MAQCLQVMRYIKLLLWQLTLDSRLYSLLFSEKVIFKRYNEGMLTKWLHAYFINTQIENIILANNGVL